MCRLMLVRADSEIPMFPFLEGFAELCRSSSEFQGDGWGIHHRSGDCHEKYKSIEAIWKNDMRSFGRANLMLVHARSAFRDSPITIDQTMPFGDGQTGFAFNGELHGVQLQTPGENGAQKIFNLISRLLDRDAERGFQRAISAVQKRTSRMRAMNIIHINGQHIWYSSTFTQAPAYFTLHIRRTPGLVVLCSQPLPGLSDWRPVPNNCVEVLQ